MLYATAVKFDRDEQAPLAGVYGRRIVNSAPAGRERIKFTKSGPEPSKGKKNIKSAAELRVLGSSRPLTSGKVVSVDKHQATKKVENKVTVNPSVIEHYHDYYGQKVADVKQKPHEKRMSGASFDSDNFSMCSDVIRHMNTHADHYVPDSDEDHYV